MSSTYTSKAKIEKPAHNDPAWDTAVRANYDILDASTGVGDCFVTKTEIPSTTRNIKVAGGSYKRSDGTIIDYAGAASTGVTASNTNYVYLTDAGVLTINTTGFPAGVSIVRLAIVVAGTTTITSVTDARINIVSAGSASGSGAPLGSAYVTIGGDATLTAERALTGTANQVVVTDNGAGSTVVLSTPQNIHTGASPTFAALTLTAPLPIASGGTGQITAAAGLNALLPTQTSNAGKVLQTDGTNASWVAAAGTGTVTSVGLSLPTGFSVSGTPVSASGTLAVTLGVSGILKGSGGALVAAAAGSDYYAPGGTDVAIADGGTGASTAALGFNALSPLTTKGDVLTYDGSNNLRIGVGANGQVLTADSTQAAGVKWAAAAGGGTVTSVALAAPAILSVSGSPVTSSGTLTLALATQTANTVFAGATSGGAATPTFRALVVADLPTVTETKGGTNQTTYTTGDILYASAANTLAKLAGNTTTTKKYYTSTGTGAAANAPALSTIAAADVPVFVASGASHAAGAVPDPGVTAGTTKFLREDATWQVPAGGGGSPGGSSGQIQYNNASAFGGTANLSYTSGGALNFAAISAPGSPGSGDLWYDSTQKALIEYGSGGIKEALVGVIFVQTASVTYTFDNAETTLFGTGVGTKTLPANCLVIGKTIRFRAKGILSKGVAGSLTLKFKLGSTVLVSCGGTALSGTLSNVAWELNLEFTCRTTGATGTGIGQGMFLYDNSTTGGTIGLPSTGTVTIDTTTSAALDFTAQWSTSTPQLSITLTNVTIELVD